MPPSVPRCALAACVACAIVVVHATPAAAAEPRDIEAIRASKRAVAVRIAEPVRVDGILDEPEWALAPPATDFYQQEPEEFEPAKRTEVRFLYDDTTLYVGAVLYDESPDRLIVNDLKRDFSGRDSDSFGLVLDTFLDRRNSYGFLTNPGGAQRETQAYENGRRNDANWHGVWFARTAIRPDGWSLEYAIPFKTLRFPAGASQTWGLNLVRIARRANETSTWAPVPRQFTHYHVGYAGTLGGIDGVQRGRNLLVTPFATARLGEGAPGETNWTNDGDGGVDVKWGVTSSLLLDATWRTDFSQVEADEQQINLTRFSTFFPEKRQFFLENPATFQVGLVERDNERPRRDLIPFFSRRIGLVDGEPIPVIGGARLSGRSGSNGIGVLTMQTDDFGSLAGDNFTAVRLTRDVSATTTLGGFYFGRESSGDRGFNRVGGFDLRLAPSRTFEVEAFAMTSATSGATTDLAGRTGFRLETPAHRARLGWLHVGESFEHDLGFVRRRGIATLFGTYTRSFRTAGGNRLVREYRAGTEGEVTGTDRYDRVLTRIGSLTYGMLFADGAELNARVMSSFERLDEPFELRPGIGAGAGEYSFEEATIEYQSNKSARLSGNLEATAGEFWDGTQRAVSGGLRYRLNAHFAASGSIGRSAVDLPTGAFTASLASVRLDWSLTPRMFLNAFVQYNGDADAWLSNVRFNLIHRPLSDIYVVWNENRLPGLTRRALQLKYTHLLVF